MAGIIPRKAENVRMQSSAPVQIASTNDARISGEAIASFGGALAKFGQEQLEVDRALKRAEFRSEVENVAKESQLFAEQTSQESGADYGQKFYESAGPKIDALKQKYGGDPRLDREFDSYLKQAKGDTDNLVLLRSAEKLQGYNNKRLEKLGESAANRVRENPAMLDSEVRSFNATMDQMAASGGMAPEKAAKAKEFFNTITAQQMVEGLEDRQQYGEALKLLQATDDTQTILDPDQAKTLGLIDSKEAAALKDKGQMYAAQGSSTKKGQKLTPQQTAVMNGMSPADKANWIDRLKAKQQERTQVRLADLNANVNGFESVALSGGNYSQAQLAELKHQVNTAPNLPLQAKVRVMDQINSADAINKQMKIAATTPRSQWQSLVEGVDNKMKLANAEAAKLDPRMANVESDFAVQANREQNKERFMKSLAQLQKQQDTDPVSVLLSSDKEIDILKRGTKDNNPQAMHDYVTTVLNKQNYLGIPADKQRILTNGEASAYAQGITNINNASDTNDYLLGLQQTYGKNFPRVMDEVTKADKDLKNYKSLVYSSPENRVKLIDAVKNAGSIDKAINDNANLKALKVSINDAISDRMAPFQKAMVEASNESDSVSIVNAMNENIELMVKRDLQRDPNANIDDLVEKAYQDVVDRDYMVVSAKNSSVIVPRNLNGFQPSEKSVQSFMDAYSSADSFKALGVYDGGNGENYKRLALSHKWVTNQSATGLRLVQVSDEGTLIPVYDKYGKQIERTYEDITFKADQNVPGASSAFLGKFGR